MLRNYKRIRRAVVAASVVAGTAMVGPGAAGAAEGTGCSPSADLGALTLEQGLALPRIVAGLEAGAYDLGELAAGFSAVDANADGLVCIKTVSKLRGSSTKHWGFLYLIDDNDHPA